MKDAVGQCLYRSSSHSSPSTKQGSTLPCSTAINHIICSPSRPRVCFPPACVVPILSEPSLGSRALGGQGSDGLALRVHNHKELTAFKASLE